MAFEQTGKGMEALLAAKVATKSPLAEHLNFKQAFKQAQLLMMSKKLEAEKAQGNQRRIAEYGAQSAIDVKGLGLGVTPGTFQAGRMDGGGVADGTNPSLSLDESGNATGKNTFKLPETLETKKKKLEIEKLEKDLGKEKKGQKQSAEGKKRFFQLYEESRVELQQAGFTSIGEASAKGLFERTTAGIQEKTGTLPLTTVLKTRSQVAANAQARQVEGGRVTDQDRKIYADALVSAMNLPDKANKRLAAEGLLDLKDMGGDVKSLLVEYENSGSSLFEDIAVEVRRIDGAAPSRIDRQTNPEYQAYLEAIKK